MSINTRERWFVLGKKPGTLGDGLVYVCAIPHSEYDVSVPEVLGDTHLIQDVGVTSVKNRVHAGKEVLTGRAKADPATLAGKQEIEEGSLVTLVLRTEQTKDKWDNLDNLPEIKVEVPGRYVRIIQL